MVLELRILKVVHSTEEQAKKLLPHIQWADIVGIENAYCSESEAVQSENGWLSYLKLSRTRCLKAVRADLAHMSEGEQDYFLKFSDYMYRNQRPIYLIERFPDQAVQELRQDGFEKERKEKETLSLLVNGHIDDFLKEVMIHFEKMFSGVHLRDKNMANILNNAEQNIRARYASLKNKPVIKMVAPMGMGHEPEKYINFPFEIVPFDGEPSLMCQLENKNFEFYCRTGKISPRETLAYGILRIEMPEGWNFTRDELLNLDEQALRKRVAMEVAAYRASR